MRRISGLVLAVLILLYSHCADAIMIQEVASIKGEVIEVYNPPVPDEGVLIDELRKNVFVKIKILEIISPEDSKKAYNVFEDKKKGSVVPVHELISKEPLVKNQVFNGELTYVILEHHKYGYVTKEVKLEVREALPDKAKQK